MGSKKYIKLIVIFLILFLITIGGIYLYKNVYVEYTSIPTISLKGSPKINVPVNSNYEELGVEAFLNDKDISKKVDIKGIVDVSKVAEYKITYVVKNNKGRNLKKAERVIKVVDEIKPTITLIGDSEIKIYKNDKYKEPGYSAVDNYDGDVSYSIQVENNVDNTKAGQYEVTYSAFDSSGNSSSLKRIVKVIERPAPKPLGPGLPVLMYHFFYDSSQGEKGYDNNWIDIALFEEHIRYLKESNYYFPTWEEVKQYVAGNLKLPLKSIVITVDDGNSSFFRLGVPILVKYGVPATSFIVTSWTNPAYVETDKSLVTFMSHSHNMHYYGCSGGGGIFRCTGYNNAYNDLTTSKQIVNNGDVFCYPFGDYNEQSIQVLKDTGFSLAFTTQYGKVYSKMNPLLLPRIRISKTTDLTSFVNAIK